MASRASSRTVSRSNRRVPKPGVLEAPGDHSIAGAETAAAAPVSEENDATRSGEGA